MADLASTSVITVMVGQCGNQLGTQLLNALARSAAAARDSSPRSAAVAENRFFRRARLRPWVAPAPRPGEPDEPLSPEQEALSRKLREIANDNAPDLLARAILVDSEPRVVASVVAEQRRQSTAVRRRVAQAAVEAAEQAMRPEEPEVDEPSEPVASVISRGRPSGTRGGHHERGGRRDGRKPAVPRQRGADRGRGGRRGRGTGRSSVGRMARGRGARLGRTIGGMPGRGGSMGSGGAHNTSRAGAGHTGSGGALVQDPAAAATASPGRVSAAARRQRTAEQRLRQAIKDATRAASGAARSPRSSPAWRFAPHAAGGTRGAGGRRGPGSSGTGAGAPTIAEAAGVGAAGEESGRGRGQGRGQGRGRGWLGCSNNWAQGHLSVGPLLLPAVMECVEREVSAAGGIAAGLRGGGGREEEEEEEGRAGWLKVQGTAGSGGAVGAEGGGCGGFLVIHSAAGGTGSGMGPLVAGALRAAYPSVPIASVIVWPLDGGETAV